MAERVASLIAVFLLLAVLLTLFIVFGIGIVYKNSMLAMVGGCGFAAVCVMVIMISLSIHVYRLLRK